ncbi:hypothetical protein ACFE04_024848 [Oxalis oulophora]
MIVQKSIHILIFCRHYKASGLPKLPKIPFSYKARAIKEAQQALTDYLQYTKSLPFVYAENITNNSLRSLANTIIHIDYSASSFPKSVSRLFRYNPINEFEFFFESIGIDYTKVPIFLPANKFFLVEDDSLFNAACTLSDFGFPWTKLGILYTGSDVFRKGSEEIKTRLNGLKELYGFGNVTVIAICLAFPFVLSGEGELTEDVVAAALLSDLKKVFLDYDLVSCVEGNVDVWYGICRKVRVFYDLMDKEKGKVGDLMGKSKSIFLDYPEDTLVKKVNFFCGFTVEKEEMGLFLLRSPEILNIDVEVRMISVQSLLKHFGMSVEDLKSVSQKYPYVLGRNKIANLPYIMRALNQQDWFLDKIKNGNHHLLANYGLRLPDEDMNKEFTEFLEKVLASRYRVHTMNKVNFMHSIGFGENALTIKVLNHLHGTSDEIQIRFNCLLDNGVEFSKICKLIKAYPKILNQNPETLRKKLRFLVEELGATLEYLDTFPGFLCFDLENRIKPRYRFHTWLTENGLSSGKSYSIASLVANSEKMFVARLYGIHPAVPKRWFECFSCKRSSEM